MSDLSKPPAIARGFTRRLLDREQSEPRAPDVGFAWAVSAMSFLLHFVVLGVVYSFSVFFSPLRSELGLDNSVASWALSANQCCLLMVGPLAGRAVERFGFRLVLLVAGSLYCLFLLCTSFVTDAASLIFVFGVLLGSSAGFVFNVAVQSVISWFAVKRAAGVGLAVAGSGIGNFAMSLLSNEMISSLGWRVTLRWFALGSFVIILGCSFGVRRRVYVATTAASRAANNKRALGFLKQRPFLMLFGSSFFVSFGYIVPFLFVRPFAIAQGYVDASTWLLSGLGIASTIGRIVLGYAADRTSKLLMIRLSFVVLGVSTLCLPSMDTIAKLATFVAFYGAFAGGFIALVAPVSAEYFPPELTPSLTGSVYFGAAAGNLFGAPIAGALIDLAVADGVTGGSAYNNGFYFAGATMLFSSLFLFLLPAPAPLAAAAGAAARSLSSLAKSDADLTSIDSFDSCNDDDEDDDKEEETKV